MTHTLVTIAFSHYCEKARWALDRFRVPYSEEAYMPLFHFPKVIRKLAGTGRGRADRASTRFSTPVLITGEGEVLTDSSEILRWVDERYAKGRLYPSSDVRALDQQLSEQLGPETRRLVYYNLLPVPRLVHWIADQNVGRAQATLFKAAYPLAARVIRGRLRIDAKRSARSEERVRAIADRIAERIADGRPYLFGDAVTAADLTFAALIAPIVLPPEYGAKLPRIEELPAASRRFVGELRDHPAGRLALKIYRQERRATP